MAERLSGLSYYGRKSDLSHMSKGKWIASLLPKDTHVLYCEPFAGRLRVLLQRPPSKVEIVNDASERVMNWWRVVRDRPAEFERLLQHTPYSRSEFYWAQKNLDIPDELYRALAFHIICTQGVIGTDFSRYWKSHKNPDVGKISLWRAGRVSALATRLREVQLECCDAVDLLKKTAGYERTVIYCDPPYREADTSPYAHDVNRELLFEALLAQKGKVAISGYGNEWDALGWHRSEMETFTLPLGSHKGNKRTEVLWTNYAPWEKEDI